MSTAGYSGTPLVKKLGIKAGSRIAFVRPPDEYSATLGTLPDGVEQLSLADGELDFVQAFYQERAALETEFPTLKVAIVKNGMVWISWPKKASSVTSDLDENSVRDIGLAMGLVDIKVAAIDNTWSGLKFVYRKEDR